MDCRSKTALAAATLGLAVGCAEDGPSAVAAPWPEANRLFREDPRWIGGDGAYSVDLGGGRVLWMFGDSFVATTPRRRRDEAIMIRNSVAIAQGYDPSSALLRFSWRRDDADGSPTSFFPEEGDRWFWPAAGMRLGDGLLVFLERVRNRPGEPPGPNSFEGDGFAAVLVENPDDDPLAWKITPARVPRDGLGMQLGEAVVRDGDDLYVYATRGSRHSVYLARFAASEARRGALDAPAWWCGEAVGYSREHDPEPVVRIGAPEFHVHRDARLGRWLMGETQGYGATTLALRIADAPEGPWSSPRDVLRPAESFEPDAFVYAGKGHPELHGADLVMTYVPSRFTLPTDESRHYYPHFARVRYR